MFLLLTTEPSNCLTLLRLSLHTHKISSSHFSRIYWEFYKKKIISKTWLVGRTQYEVSINVVIVYFVLSIFSLLLFVCTPSLFSLSSLRNWKRNRKGIHFFFRCFGDLERGGLACGNDVSMSVFLCLVFHLQTEKETLFNETRCLLGFSVVEKQGPCPAKLTKDHRGRDGRVGF